MHDTIRTTRIQKRTLRLDRIQNIALLPLYSACLPAFICDALSALTLAYVSIRQHTSAYLSIPQHTSAYLSIPQHTSAYLSIPQHTSAYLSVPQHTSAYTLAALSAVKCTGLLAVTFTRDADITSKVLLALLVKRVASSCAQQACWQSIVRAMLVLLVKCC
jgi:hypothetical protein